MKGCGIGCLSAIVISILIFGVFYMIGTTGGDGLTDEQRNEYLFKDMTIEEFDKIYKESGLND